MPATHHTFVNLSSWKFWSATGAAFMALVACVLICERPHTEPAPKLKAFVEPSGPVMSQRASSALANVGMLDAAPAPPPPAPAAVMRLQEAKVAPSGQMSAAPSGDGGFSPAAPMIAHTISLTVSVKDLAVTRAALDAVLAHTHGYAAQLAAGSPEEGPRTLSASLRVPAPALEAALAEMKRLGRVLNESQGGEEVTSQHQDLAARLKTARETEERYRAILLQRTGKVSDVLEVEEQIASTRGEIERMEAEQQALEHRVDFASVDVQFTEEYKAHLETPSDSVLTQVRNAMVAGLRHVGDSLLGLLLFAEEYGPAIVVWVFLLGVPALVLWRRHRREQASPQAAVV